MAWYKRFWRRENCGAGMTKSHQVARWHMPLPSKGRLDSSWSNLSLLSNMIHVWQFLTCISSWPFMRINSSRVTNWHSFSNYIYVCCELVAISMQLNSLAAPLSRNSDVSINDSKLVSDQWLSSVTTLVPICSRFNPRMLVIILIGNLPTGMPGFLSKTGLECRALQLT